MKTNTPKPLAILLAVLVWLALFGCNPVAAQTDTIKLDTFKSKPFTGKFQDPMPVSDATCDTCKTAYVQYAPFTIYKQPERPSTQFWYDNAIKMKISAVDSNGQQTGWFDKRYVKITSDSTFVILPKTPTK